MNYQDINARTIDGWIEDGWEWGRPISHETYEKALQDENAGVQFSHSLEEQIGGQLEAGFRLLNLYEDTNSMGRLYELGIPSFIATRAKKE